MITEDQLSELLEKKTNVEEEEDERGVEEEEADVEGEEEEEEEGCVEGKLSPIEKAVSSTASSRLTKPRGSHMEKVI